MKSEIRNQKSEIALHLAAAGGVPLVAYLATAPRHVLDGDSAVFATQAYRLGLAHPPGYPLMGVLGKLVTTCVPLGPLAWRANLVAVAAAVAALLLAYAVLRRWGVPRAVAVLATWLMAFSPLFWSQALHVNPYIVALATAFGIVLLLDIWAERLKSEIRNPKSEIAWLASAAFLYGLGMGGHPSLALYLPGVALFVALRVGRKEFRDSRLAFPVPILVGLAAAALGCLVWLGYDLYYLRAGAASEAQGRGLWGFLTASETDSDPRRFFTGVASAGYPAQLALHVARALAELSPVGAVLAVVGWVALVRRRGWPVALLVGLGYLMQMNFAATLRHWHFYDVYRLPCHAIQALLIGVGLSALAARVRLKSEIRNPKSEIAMVVAAVLVLGPPYAALGLLPEASRGGLQALRPKAPWRGEFARNGQLDGLEALGRAAPEGTIVANYGPYGTLVFLQRVEGAGAGVRLEAGFGPGGERLCSLLGAAEAARVYAYLRHDEDQARRALARRFELREAFAGTLHTLYEVRALR